jgi:hypothetical protein
MVQTDKKTKKRIVKGPGFSLKIPTDFVGRSEDDPRGQWGYGEFLRTITFSKDLAPQTIFLFFYWQRTKNKLSEKQVKTLIKDLCQSRLFSSDHELDLIESWPITFQQFSGFLLKYNFSHFEPQARGKLCFYVSNNTRQHKIFVLGAVIEGTGKGRAEREVVTWIEDEIISSFRFEKLR